MGDVHGRQAFKETIVSWTGAVPDVRCEIDHVIEEGDIAAWLVRTTGTHTGGGLGFAATGKWFETVSANMGRLVDGRVVEHWSEQGMLPMLLQLGLLQRPGPT